MPRPHIVQYPGATNFNIPMNLSPHYPNRWQLMDSDFYMDVACVVPTPTPGGLAGICSQAYAFRSANESNDFRTFFRDWVANLLVLYRGFPGCHYCWPDLLNGSLESEGNRDYPEFTMNGHGRGDTRWLPSADLNTAQGVSFQCCDAHTQALFLHEPVPIGFTVAIPCGSGSGRSICWLNAGEIVIRGPLMAPQYRMHSITWMDPAPRFAPWPAAFSNVLLPTQRPYQPASQSVIDTWWDLPHNQAWMGLMAVQDGVIAAAAPAQALASAARAARRLINPVY
jgi:hypothetical protein